MDSLAKYIASTAHEDPDWLWTIGKRWGRDALATIVLRAARDGLAMWTGFSDNMLREGLNRIALFLEEAAALSGDDARLKVLEENIRCISDSIDLSVYEGIGGIAGRRIACAARAAHFAAIVLAFRPEHILEDTDPDEVAARREAGASYWACEAIQNARCAIGVSLDEIRDRVLDELRAQ